MNQNDKFIIIETNFKLYAYTSSLLYTGILSKQFIIIYILEKFVKIEAQFPNLVVGVLTKESLKPAFLQGISSSHIKVFLESHIHDTTRLSRMLLQEDIKT